MLSDSEEDSDESSPSSGSEPDEASDSEDDFSPKRSPRLRSPRSETLLVMLNAARSPLWTSCWSQVGRSRPKCAVVLAWQDRLSCLLSVQLSSVYHC